jgi:hypothetical protein
LAFFAFFAFFAFLAMVSSSQGLNGNATPRHAWRRASLATSSAPIQQIRGALPRTVTPLSSRYPQLLCIFGTISPSEWILRRKNRNRRERSHLSRGLVRVNDAPTLRCILRRSGTGSGPASSSIQNHSADCTGRGEIPLNGAAAG